MTNYKKVATPPSNFALTKPSRQDDNAIESHLRSHSIAVDPSLPDDKLAHVLKLADLGNPDALDTLKQKYCHRRLAEKDVIAARLGLEKLAAQGHVSTQYLLAISYDGSGEQKDIEQAVFWYQRAANVGFKKAQFALGVMYDAGTGVPKDDKLAFFWIEAAAYRGLPEAQVMIGTFLQEGTGAPKNEKHAITYFHKAARFNYPDALYQLGVAYAKGIGVKRDPHKALQYFAQADQYRWPRAEHNSRRTIH
jgi:TPR repeat protein